MKITKRRLFKMLLAAPLAVVAAKVHFHGQPGAYAKIVAEDIGKLPLAISKRQSDEWIFSTQEVLDNWGNLERIARGSLENAR